ncbi:MAG TPA: hypothetical protein VGF55_20710 [Gemmataceae bacterium]|jgi:hypothetical protein
MPSRPYYILRYAGLGSNAYPGQVIYLWSPTGQLPPYTSAYFGDGELELLPPTWYGEGIPQVNQYVMCLKVADDALIGESYFKDWPYPDGGNQIEVNIVADPTPNNPYCMPLCSDQDAIQDAISAGYSPIYLSGDVRITYSFDLTGPHVAPIVVIDGQNSASLTAAPELGDDMMFNVTRPLNLQRLSFYGSKLDLTQRVLGSTSPQHVDINVTLCRFVDISLGYYYLPDYDPDDGDDDAYTTGIVVDRCEFVRGSGGIVPTGAVFRYCRFTETAPNSGAHVFYPSSKKWLVFSCDWVRTTRGIVCQGIPTKNGVVAACRFWDIAQGGANAGEVILLEFGGGYPDTMFNNAFICCHMYNSPGGLQLVGAGMHDNRFLILTCGGITLDGYKPEGGETDLIDHNQFQDIELHGRLSVSGHCADNYFNQIVALRNPLQHDGDAPVLAYYGYNPDVGSYQGFLPFSDTSTHDPLTEHANRYYNLYMSYPDRLLHVFMFPNVPHTENPESPPPP